MLFSGIGLFLGSELNQNQYFKQNSQRVREQKRFDEIASKIWK
jgi:hypothetical protein